MSRKLAVSLAVLAAVSMLAALGAMVVDELLIAGFCFLFASFVIYLRETRA